MPAIAPDLIGGKNIAAFLDMLAVSEGTDIPKQPTRNHGYDVMVGGGLIESYAAHPGKVVKLSDKLSSSAAGRYQFLRGTWKEIATLLSLPDFSPISQDRACVQLLKRRNAYRLIQAGKFDAAVLACSKEWASLPGAGYGQHEQKIERLRAAYVAAGGVIAP